jgi:hypothetical protein
MRLFGMARLACGVVENDRHDALTYEGGRQPATRPFINAIFMGVWAASFGPGFINAQPHRFRLDADIHFPG